MLWGRGERREGQPCGLEDQKGPGEGLVSTAAPTGLCSQTGAGRTTRQAPDEKGKVPRLEHGEGRPVLQEGSSSGGFQETRHCPNFSTH